VGFLQFELAQPELLVLHLELDLVDLELVQERGGGLLGLRQWKSASEPRLRLCPQSLGIIRLELARRLSPLCPAC